MRKTVTSADRVQQQNFSPNESTMEIEDYEVNLKNVRMLQVVVNPEIGNRAAIATLASRRVA
jgi:hypothetical protein